jgi:hypothetical protein
MLIVPPGSGIVHQVNLEYLARVCFTKGEVSHHLYAASHRCCITSWGIEPMHCTTHALPCACHLGGREIGCTKCTVALEVRHVVATGASANDDVNTGLPWRRAKVPIRITQHPLEGIFAYPFYAALQLLESQTLTSRSLLSRVGARLTGALLARGHRALHLREGA